MAIKGDGDTTAGLCYMDPNVYVGSCKKQLGDAVIPSSGKISISSAVNTLPLCKTECLTNNAAICTGYGFEGKTCTLYKTGTS